jgi:hypothetical protein
MERPIAKGGNPRDQNHSRQISVALASVGRTICDAVHNGGHPDRWPQTGQTPKSQEVNNRHRRAMPAGRVDGTRLA